MRFKDVFTKAIVAYDRIEQELEKVRAEGNNRFAHDLMIKLADWYWFIDLLKSIDLTDVVIDGKEDVLHGESKKDAS